MKLWPTRQKHSKPELIADLDAMVSEPFAFVLHGKERVVKPIQLDEFLKYTNAYAELFNKLESEENKMGEVELLRLYTNLFKSVCDDINEEDIKQMSQAQIGALFQLISDSVMGKSHVDKKKTIMKATQVGMNRVQ